MEDISASSAFQVLDELSSLGKISQTTVTKLKDGFKLLHDTLKSVHSSEVRLLGEAKRRRAELERLQLEVQSLEELQCPSEEPDGEVSKLRRQLLQVYSELRAAEEREHTARHELQCLWEEKRYLEREIQTQPAEVEGNTDMLKDKHDVLKKEVAQRQLDVRTLMEDLETLETLLLKEQKELEEMKEIIEIKEAEKAQLACIPNKIIEDTERKRSLWDVAMKNMESLNLELSETKHQMRSVNERNQSLEVLRGEAMQELERLRAQIEARQKENRRLMKEQEICREESAEIMGSRGILEMKLQNLMTDRKQLYDSRSVQLRKKNRQMEALKRMEHAVAMATEQLVCTQSAYKEIQAQVVMAAEETQNKHQSGMIQELLRESNHLREELHHLRCLRQIKAEERGNKHHEWLKAQQLSERIQQELSEKELIIMDHNKLNEVLQRRISQFSKLCDKFMKEKNKYVRLKQIASQTHSELTEQLNILGNEMEIQRSIADSKDRLLTKARMKISSSSKMRERLRNEISKLTWKQHQISQQYEDNKQELMNITQRIEFQEGILLGVKENHTNATQRRTFLGIRLLEQDKVLSNYYEQTKNLEAAITNGNMATETIEKDMRELQIEINEEKRLIDLKTREVSLKRKLEEEVIMLQIELSAAREDTLNSVNHTLEYRELKGEDPPASELIKKMEQLEVNLAERESQLQEKELLVERVTRLSKPLEEQEESCRLGSLSVAKKLNEARTNIININLCLMAISAELSTKQAVALSERRRIKEKELQLSAAREDTLNSVNHTLEYRELKGEDPPASELIKKMEQLEVNLAERESQLQEKELLVERVTRLSKPLEEQEESCRLGSLSVAKKRTRVQMSIRNSDDVFMANPAELTVKRAAALSEQPEIKENSLKMAGCQGEDTEGILPYLDLEEGWRRMFRDRKRRQREKEEKKKLAEESKWRQLPNGVHTTAEARPNAYIPQDDRLGLPVPFGRFPPIKPRPQGAYMRHYRNPTIKPWEI